MPPCSMSREATAASNDGVPFGTAHVLTLPLIRSADGLAYHCMRMMDKICHRRYPEAGGFLEDLDRHPEPPGEEPVSRFSPQGARICVR